MSPTPSLASSTALVVLLVAMMTSPWTTTSSKYTHR